MSLTVHDAAAALDEARAGRTALVPFTDAEPTLDEAWGYAVQDVLRARRIALGERVIGRKLGLTSEAKQRRMQVDRPIVGFLTDALPLEPAGVGRAIGGWIQPRIEPEILFVVGRELDEPLTREDAAAAVAAVTVAAEVIDSRFVDYRFRLPDVVADNTSAAGVLVGPTLHSPDAVGDLAALRCSVEVDEEVVHEATGAAILGDPLEALVHLSHHLARRGETLPAGSLVLAGALTDAVPLERGRRYRLAVERLGEIAVAP